MSRSVEVTVSLDPELKARWIAALRSGEFPQGQKALYDGQAYCCLGVLAKITGVDMKRARSLCWGSLCEAGRNLLGPWSPHGEWDDSFDADNEATLMTVQRKLAGMNDRGMSFAEIADWIEGNL